MSTLAVNYVVAQLNEVKSPSARLLLVIIASHTGKATGLCSASIATLAEETGFKRTTIKTYLAELAEHETQAPFIVRKPRWRDNGSRSSDEIFLPGFKEWCEEIDDLAPKHRKAAALVARIRASHKTEGGDGSNLDLGEGSNSDLPETEGGGSEFDRGPVALSDLPPVALSDPPEPVLNQESNLIRAARAKADSDFTVKGRGAHKRGTIRIDDAVPLDLRQALQRMIETRAARDSEEQAA